MKVSLGVVAALSCLGFVAKAEVAPLELKQTIPLPGVEGRFDHFALDLKGQRLFIAALGNNTLEIIDLNGGKHLQSIKGLHKPTGVLHLPQQNQICVANGDDGTFKIFDGTSYKLIESLSSLDDADNARFDEKTGLLYLGYGDGALAVIHAAKVKVTAHIKLKVHPESFQLEKNGTRIFVNVPDAKQIAVVDREKRAVVETWPMKDFSANFPMALDEGNKRLFVGFRSPTRLGVFDTEGGKRVSEVAISGDTDDLFCDAKRKRIYVSCGEGFIDVIERTSQDSYKPLTKISTAAGARTSFFSPDRSELYLAVPHRGNQQAEIRVYKVN